jgi:hypothetical protein
MSDCLFTLYFLLQFTFQSAVSCCEFGSLLKFMSSKPKKCQKERKKHWSCRHKSHSCVFFLFYFQKQKLKLKFGFFHTKKYTLQTLPLMFHHYLFSDVGAAKLFNNLNLFSNSISSRLIENAVASSYNSI